MRDQLLAIGPPPLTVDAADAAIDVIDFIAAAVRGVDMIDVTETLRPLWRQHLAAWYPQLPPVTRQWYANAPTTLTWLRAQWPLLHPAQRAMIVQQWSMELPQMLWMLEPVLAQEQTNEILRQRILANLAQMRAQLAQAVSPAPVAGPTEVSRMSSQQAIDELNRRTNTNVMLQNHATTMAGLTIGLMGAMSGHR